jgi:WD40 repeat protein/serine/threonine protein kinase
MKEDSATIIDKYEIKATIHQSSEGILYKALDSQSGTPVLLKRYYPSLLWSEDVLDEFFNLASYLRFIEHDYLLPILDVGKYEGQPYIVFAGESSNLISYRLAGQFNEKDTLNFCHRVAEVLDFLHKQEILHGMLNSTNIILDAEGYPLVFDYGLHGVIKKLLLENMDDGFDNLAVSSLTCTSPEQVQGRNPTRSSDIYSFGIICYYYAFGEFPFQGEFVSETAVSHLQQGVVRMVKIPKDVPNSFLQFIQKCIQVEPETRFANFQQVLNAAERMITGERTNFRFQPRFMVEHISKHPRVSWTAIIGVLVVAALIASYAFYAQNSQNKAPVITAIALSQVPVSPPSVTDTPSSIIHDALTNPMAATATLSSQAPPVTVAYKPAFEGDPPNLPNQTISLTNLAQIREISRLGYGKPEQADVSSDSNYVALAASSGVFIFRGTQIVKWIDPQGWATSVQFSPDGKVLAIGLASGDIQLWDWTNEIKSATLAGHTKRLNRILFSQNGLLYSASSDQNVKVWNWAAQKLIETIHAHSQPVNDIAVTSDARTLVTCSDDQLIRVWDLASGKKLYELDAKDQDFAGSIKAIALSSDNLYLAAGGDAGFLYQWKLVDSSAVSNPIPQRRTDIVPVKSRIWSLAYIRNDSQLLLGVDDGGTLTYDATRQKYGGVSLRFEIAARASRLVDVFGSSFKFDSSAIFDGTNIISINWDGKITSQQSQLLDPMYDILDRLDFSPDGTILAAGGRRGTTNVWNLKNNQRLLKNLYVMPFGDPITPDGSAIAILVPKAVVVSRQTGETITENIYQMKNISGGPNAKDNDLSEAVPNGVVSYAHHGAIFISANLTTSKAWDYASNYEIFSNGYPQTGCWVTTSANDGEKLQVNSAAGVLPAWNDLGNKLCPKSIQFIAVLSALSANMQTLIYINPNGLLEGYDIAHDKVTWQYTLEHPATALAISPDGSIVAVGDTTGILTFIDGTTGKFVEKITGNFGALHAILFSEDGKTIATAGQDGTARIFGIVENQ